MTTAKARWKARERHAAGKQRRERKRAGRRRAAGARRRVAGKALLVAAVLALLLALALLVGDADYRATLMGWTPFVAAVCLVVLAFAYVRVLAAGLVLSEELVLKDCKRGREVPFTLRLRNATPLVCFRIEAEFFISDLFGNVANEVTTTVTLGPRESYELDFTMCFEHIGTYTAGLRKVTVYDFFGLFSKVVSPETHHEVQVTPKLQPLERIMFDDTATEETAKAAKSILADSLDYSHVREYVPGDPLKTIHWKLSARSEDYLTRLYEVYNEPGVGIFMDFHANDGRAGVLMGMFDAVVEAAFSVADYTTRKGMDTEVHYTNKYGEPRRVISWDDDAMPDIIDELPAMTVGESGGADVLAILRRQIMDQRGQSTLVLCSASMDPELINALVDAKTRKRSPFMIAVAPPELAGRALDAYCRPLSRLDEANIPYVVISRSEDLAVRLA